MNTIFSDLPVDITSKIVNLLDIDDIISLEHAFNPVYTRYYENGGIMSDYPRYITVKKLSYGLTSDIVKCNIEQLKMIPSLYHDKLILDIPVFIEVFGGKRRTNIKHCKLIYGIIFQGLESKFSNSIDFSMLTNLSFISAKKIDMRNLIKLQNLKELEIDDCSNVHDICSLQNLKKLRCTNIYNINIYNLPEVEIIECSNAKEGEYYELNIEYVWMNEFSAYDLPSLKELKLECVVLRKLKNLPKLKKLECHNLIHSAYVTKENPLLFTINHLQSIESISLTIDEFISDDGIIRFNFNELNNLMLIKLSKVILNKMNAVDLDNLIKRGVIIDIK